MVSTRIVTVASMFGRSVTEEMFRHAPFLRFLPVSFAAESTLPPGIEILLAMPVNFQPGHRQSPRPVGWPSGCAGFICPRPVWTATLAGCLRMLSSRERPMFQARRWRNMRSRPS